MKAVLELNYHQDPQIFRVNEMPSRAYFIPFSSENPACLSREESPFFHSLNGEWKFLYKPSLYDMEDFYEAGYDDSHFDPVTVPECWQCHGVDYAQYVPSSYPFPVDPPRVPEQNPAAAYVREFEHNAVPGKRYELHFEGKDSCIYVWLNGDFVGYSEVPHSETIFDVTDLLVPGENRLCVLVLKWCSGSYMDDQDKIRLSGLFRDVYLLERQEGGISDFRLTAGADGKLSVDVKASLPVRLAISDGDRILLEASDVACGEYSVENPRLWTAEDPYLYTLTLICGGEKICHSFGFRDVAVKNGVFTVNGVPVKIFGVNRHDSDPDTGYAVDVAHMTRDILMMKRHNINAVRTSHYPNDPRFYRLCDRFGLYVMSEADAECHLCQRCGNWDDLVDDPTWGAMIHDRQYRMFENLKNYTCITMWSLGNESDWGCNLKDEADYFHRVDPTRPLHYEGAFCGSLTSGTYKTLTNAERRYIRDGFDFFSRMYPKLNLLKETLDDPMHPDCIILCEYSHAMGNSCGDLMAYDDIFYSDPRYAGGYIWEWCDHALRLTDETGKGYFGYGGDFGDVANAGNVCMDGLVTPDRRPHSSLLEAKAVFAPVRIYRNEAGETVLWNRYFFSDLSDVEIVREAYCGGELKNREVLKISLNAGEKMILPDPGTSDDAESYVIYRVLLKNPTLWADGGHELFAASFPLSSEIVPQAPSALRPELVETAAEFIVSAGNAVYTFRKDLGTLTGMKVNGEEVLAGPLSLNVFRAPTDNDFGMGRANAVHNAWKQSVYGNIAHAREEIWNLRAEETPDGVALSAAFLIYVPSGKPLLYGTARYLVTGDGKLQVSQDGKLAPEYPAWLPRYGYTLPLKKWDDIRYFGYGPGECYEDKHHHVLLGHYTYLPDDPAEYYEKPQESGSHWSTRWVKVPGFTVSGDFSFCVSRYTPLAKAGVRHTKDLIPEENAILYLDYRMSGVGSHSCGGQDPEEKYRINPGEAFDFTVTLSPQ